MPRKSLRERINPDASTPQQEPVYAPLTPLARRMFAALNHVAEEYDELRMIIRGFEKMHRRTPWTDEELSSTLGMVRDHIGVILQESPTVESHTA